MRRSPALAALAATSLLAAVLPAGAAAAEPGPRRRVRRRLRADQRPDRERDPRSTDQSQRATLRASITGFTLDEDGSSRRSPARRVRSRAAGLRSRAARRSRSTRPATSSR